jgi:hypothetical protein
LSGIKHDCVRPGRMEYGPWNVFQLDGAPHTCGLARTGLDLISRDLI